MADLTKPRAYQTSFPAIGQTIPRPAAVDTYYKGMFLDLPKAGGNQVKASGGDLRFSGICQENKKIETAGDDLDVLWGIFFWYPSSTLAVKGNVGKLVTADDSGALALTVAANRSIVGRIAGVKDGEAFIDATASFAEVR